MTSTRVSAGVMLGVLLFLAGCSDSTPTEPQDAPITEEELQTRLKAQYPSAPATAEVYDRESWHRATGWYAHSRYVLFENRTFELQWVDDWNGHWALTGEFSREGPIVTLDFDPMSLDFLGTVDWTTTAAIFDGNRLHVDYSGEMSQAWRVFEDGVYLFTSTE